MWIVVLVIACLAAMATAFSVQGTQQADQAQAVYIKHDGELLHSFFSIASYAQSAPSCQSGALSWTALVDASKALGFPVGHRQTWCDTLGTCSKGVPEGRDHVWGSYVVCGEEGAVASYRLGSSQSQYRVYADIARRTYTAPAGSMTVGFTKGGGNLYRADGSRIPVSSSTSAELLKNLPAGALVVLGGQ